MQLLQVAPFTGAWIETLTEEQRALRRMEFEIFNELFGAVCSSIENLEKYEPLVMAEMYRLAHKGAGL